MIEKDKRKKRIIDAAINILKTRPAEEVSMRNIATEAGLTTGAIYYHYKNKEELFFAVMQETLHFSNDIYSRLVDTQNDLNPKELLEEINSNVENRLRRVEEQKFHIQVISDILKQKGDITERYRKDYSKVLESVGELIVQAFELDDNPNKKFMAHFLVAAVDGMALQQAVEVLPEDMDEMIKHFIKFFNQSIPNYLDNNK